MVPSISTGTGHANGHTDHRAKLPSRLFKSDAPPSVSTLATLCNRQTSTATNPQASRIEKNIPIYDTTHLAGIYETESQLSAFQDELYHTLLSGPGVFVLKNMYSTPSVVDAATDAFRNIIARERSTAKGDHFAAGGKNDRIWNSFGKHCLEDPQSFVDYYKNPWLAVVCEAWLGPGYRVTAQTNVVKPGGAAQVSHRDYHLGFQTLEGCSRYPKALQAASQLLTLQGAVAHSDMPIDSGPTRFLPFSQTFEEGFMAYRLPEFTQYFQDHYVALPLSKGDGVFFNPALFHAAGSNHTKDFERIANLIQVSSPFGKPMETVDSLPLVEKCWDRALETFSQHADIREMKAFASALGEGYPFPTNLDRMVPAPGKMAPSSEQDMLLEALLDRRTTEEVVRSLRQQRQDAAA